MNLNFIKYCQRSWFYKLKFDINKWIDFIKILTSFS